MNVAEAVRAKVDETEDRRAIRFSEIRRALEWAPTNAVEQAFSRLVRAGTIARVTKGLYWKAPRGRFGIVPPRPLAAAFAAAEGRAPGPAGPTAAAFLGLTTQVPPVNDLAVIGRASTKLRGVVFHQRANPRRLDLTPREIAVLELARDRCRFSELPKAEVIARLRAMAADGAIQLERVRFAATHEPRHVEEFVGAIG